MIYTITKPEDIIDFTIKIKSYPLDFQTVAIELFQNVIQYNESHGEIEIKPPVIKLKIEKQYIGSKDRLSTLITNAKMIALNESINSISDDSKSGRGFLYIEYLKFDLAVYEKENHIFIEAKKR